MKAVRQDKTTFDAILSNPLKWRHYWVVQSISVGQSSQLSTHRQPNLESGTAAELRALQETARRLSSSPSQYASQEFLGDEFFDESGYSFRPAPYGPKGGKGGGGRGKGKGKKGFAKSFRTSYKGGGGKGFKGGKKGKGKKGEWY